MNTSRQICEEEWNVRHFPPLFFMLLPPEIVIFHFSDRSLPQRTIFIYLVRMHWTRNSIRCPISTSSWLKLSRLAGFTAGSLEDWFNKQCNSNNKIMCVLKFKMEAGNLETELFVRCTLNSIDNLCCLCLKYAGVQQTQHFCTLHYSGVSPLAS